MSNDATPTRPGRREREQARHRREILDAAEALFAERGFHQTTMQMVAERAEFSVGYLYKHFAGKEEIYQEMVTFHLERMDELITAVAAEELSPLAELRRTYEEIARHFNRHPTFMRIFHQEIGGEYCGLIEAKKRHHEDIVDILSRAQAAGEMAPYNPAVLAAAIQGATKELLGTMAERDVENPFDELADTIFYLIIDPLRN